MRKKFTKAALVVVGVAAFSGVAAGPALAADGPGKPGDGIADATYKVGSIDECRSWGENMVRWDSNDYVGYACWQDEHGQWYLDLML
ncbi:hypothetical protein [Streptomyces sp. 891-h]|uniref:hypothetical protein n=1 Tax=unclassified Streptomyces TaxID=2593676 RepID=UPI001FA96575|nr:hypothetical protein [Streptomyces sp. 891-h]UNZ16706.1 hypothetical protein HC362_06100 [Streptomyces sp. 891-h]